jgi:hypothetical protein
LVPQCGQVQDTDWNRACREIFERLARHFEHVNVKMNNDITAISANAITPDRNVWLSGVLEPSHRTPQAGIVIAPAIISRYRVFKRSRTVIRSFPVDGMEPIEPYATEFPQAMGNPALRNVRLPATNSAVN